MNTHNPTPPEIPLAELLAFARLGHQVRAFQKEYFRFKKERNFAAAEGALKLSMYAEGKLDAALSGAKRSPHADIRVLARMADTMRAAQKAFFEKKRKNSTASADDELRAAKRAEIAFDSALAGAFKHEQPSLPYMDDGGAEGGAPA